MFRPDEMLMNTIDTWIENNKENLVKDLDRLVAIPSIAVEGDGMYPFGRDCAGVLDEMARIAAEHGLWVENHEYYCGSCLIEGACAHPRRIGLFAHLDIVPPGEGWQYPPLRCTNKDGFLIGRGVGDNKGPGICVLYTLKYFVEHGIRLKHDVMAFFGLAEETGMKDIEYFVKNRQIPDFCLVTDTNFPVCYGEKGLLRVEAELGLEGNLVSFHGGDVVNVIPAKAEALISGLELQTVNHRLAGRERITVEPEGDLVRVTACGLSKHAAFPEGSVNAIQVLAEALAESGMLEGSAAAAVRAVAELTSDYYGVAAGIPFEDEESGRLTCVGSVVRLKSGRLTLSFDIRYPVTAEGERVVDAVQNRLESLGFTVRINELSEPAYTPLDHPYIPVLSGICDYVQGTHYDPYTMGGGTYSRHLPSAIGFGPGVFDAPNPFGEGHGQGHQPDECVPLDMLLKGLKTYIISLMELDKVL